MFVHAYDGYMEHAFPGGELLPLSCGSGQLHLVKVCIITPLVRRCWFSEKSAVAVVELIQPPCRCALAAAAAAPLPPAADLCKLALPSSIKMFFFPSSIKRNLGTVRVLSNPTNRKRLIAVDFECLIKVPLVTLVDSLDALAMMGNATEFRRAVR